MSFLLDTHILLWWLADEQISAEAAARIGDPETLVAVSAASVWEASIKAALGKLRVEGSLVEAIGSSGFESLAISLVHAERAGNLPPHHRDPFDRILIAQAELEGFTLITRDGSFQAYDVEVLVG